MNEYKNKILKRIYLKGNLKTVSPLIIGNGIQEKTDIDFFRNNKGEFVIPGTSIAGAVRNYCKKLVNDNNIVNNVFGGIDKNSNISSIIFYDSILENNNYTVKTRDGVRIDKCFGTAEDKSKYDFEIIESGQNFDFRLELVQREKTDNNAGEIVEFIADSMANEKIRFGAKTRRGFGKVKLEDISYLELDMKQEDDIKKWINFSWDDFNDNKKETFNYNLSLKSKKVINITTEFNLPYSIIIRTYNPEPDSPDSSHIKDNNNFVIPGTSFNGCLRNAVDNIGKELNKSEEIKQIEQELFGWENNAEHSDDNAIASRIYIDETVIDNNNAQNLVYTRNKIDRFTGGTVDTALFDEQPVYRKLDKGMPEVNLNIEIEDYKDYEVGLIIMAIQDICNGIQPIGGGSNIGRGILEGKSISINGEKYNFTDEKVKQYISALANKLNGGINNE